MGRKPINQEFFDNNLDKWALAGNVASESVMGATVREFATMYNEEEFYRFLIDNSVLFAKHLPMKEWKRYFKVKA